MPFDFPAGPTQGQLYTFNGITYVWSGYAWLPQPPTIPPPEPGSQLAVYWVPCVAPAIPANTSVQLGAIDVTVKSPTSKLICQTGMTVQMGIGQPSHHYLKIMADGTTQIAYGGVTSDAVQGEWGCIATSGIIDHGLAAGSLVNIASIASQGAGQTAVMVTAWFLVQEIEE